MSHSKKHAIRLAPQHASDPGSKIRTQFNTLIKQLEDERKRLVNWHEAIPAARARADREMTPLLAQYHESLRELAVLFDEAWDNKKITNKESTTLSMLIVDICEELFDVSGDNTLDEIYARHAGLDGELDDLEDDPEYLALKKSLGDQIDAMFEQLDMPGIGGDDDAGTQSEARTTAVGARASQAPRKHGMPQEESA